MSDQENWLYQTNTNHNIQQIEITEDKLHDDQDTHRVVTVGKTLKELADLLYSGLCHSLDTDFGTKSVSEKSHF